VLYPPKGGKSERKGAPQREFTKKQGEEQKVRKDEGDTGGRIKTKHNTREGSTTRKI